MIINGNKIAADIFQQTKNKIDNLNFTPKLSIITYSPNFVTEKYLHLKCDKASWLGIETEIIKLKSDASTLSVIEIIKKISPNTNGIIVQLPLLLGVDLDKVLKSIPIHLDPDAFSYVSSPASAPCLPPVVGAIEEISKFYNINFCHKEVVILGQGRLVGKPAAVFTENLGAQVKIVTEHEGSLSDLSSADLIISGIGKPGFIKPEQVKEGVVIFDAGTSETNGVLSGDVKKTVADKASFFTPVPGGIGPITISYLFRNLVLLFSQGCE